MSNSIIQRIFLPTVVVVAGFAGIVFLSGFIAHSRPAMPEGYGDSDLNVNGSRLKGYAFGMEGLLADWYWMRSLQYIGDKMLGRKDSTVDIDNLRPLNPRLLYPLLENTTNLDPHFIAAYSYGSIVLPAIDNERAIEFAKKGISNNPDEWRLYQHLGYIYWKLGRYEIAAETYSQGALISGASPFLKLMAASMKTEGGSRSTARAIYRQMLADSDEEPVRITAERRLDELDSIDEREVIDKALFNFRIRSGRCADNLNEVFPQLMHIKLDSGREFRIDKLNQLVDPTDAPYVLDKENCRVKLDAERTGLPLK